MQTPREFDYLYKRRIAQNNNYTYTFFATVAYDALWTFALVLNRTNAMVGSLTREEILNRTRCGGTDEETGVEWEVVSLENFTYTPISSWAASSGGTWREQTLWGCL